MAELRVKSTGTLKLFESDNTSSVTIASPASLSANKTITLPDADVTLASGTMLATDGDGSSLTGLTPGITTASIWRLTTNFDGDADPIASNLEETDAPTGFGILGSSMTESSGVFTFPSTGYWYISFNFMVYNDTADGRTVITIKTTHDDGTWAPASYANVWAASGGLNNAMCDYIFDVTSTSTHKCSFQVDATNASNGCLGGTATNYTWMTFIRLGDT